LESAFAYYHWIPEAVFTITSVSTLKTKAFDTPVGHFRYSSVKPTLFWGYTLLKVEAFGVKIAEPEKALLDFLYLNPKVESMADFEALRFDTDQMRQDIDREKLSAYVRMFDSVSLSKRVHAFIQFLDYAQSI
jgi:predicted transcriptional regulator of viral defense system